MAQNRDNYPPTFAAMLGSLVGEPVEVRLNNGKSITGKLVFLGEDYLMLEAPETKGEIRMPAIPLLAIDYVV